MERSPLISIQPSTFNNIVMLTTTTLSSLPDDILYIIKKNLDFASMIALRSACRQIYSAFPDSLLFSEIVLLSTLTQQRFDNIFSNLLSTNKTQYIRKLTFDQSQITERAIVSVLEHCKNLQKLYILACEQVKLLPMTNAMVKWHQDESGNSPNLKELRKIIMTRCIGGKRHSLIVKKIIEDLYKLKYNDFQRDNSNIDMVKNPISENFYPCIKSNSDDTNDGIFQFQTCQRDICEFCNMSCVSCKTKYKYWDEFWMKCGWCKGRNFCGQCIMEASKKNTFKNYTFQFMRIKLCQIFDLPCPF